MSKVRVEILLESDFAHPSKARVRITESLNPLQSAYEISEGDDDELKKAVIDAIQKHHIDLLVGDRILINKLSAGKESIHRSGEERRNSG